MADQIKRSPLRMTSKKVWTGKCALKFCFTLTLVEYLNTLLGRFGLKDVVLVAPGFSGSYVLPYIFSDHRQNVRGLVTVSPDYVDHYTDDDYRNLNIPTLVFYGEYDGEGEINARRLRKIPGTRIENQ